MRMTPVFLGNESLIPVRSPSGDLGLPRGHCHLTPLQRVTQSRGESPS